MKKYLILLTIGAVITACSSNEKKTSAEDSAAAAQTYAEPRPSEYETAQSGDATASDAKGKQLITQSDCLTCHKENEKLIGPSYTEVAKKYEVNDKNLDYLAGKIIEGGSGVWGEVAMTPHPNLSKEDAKEMAMYILSLK